MELSRPALIRTWVGDGVWFAMVRAVETVQVGLTLAHRRIEDMTEASMALEAMIRSQGRWLVKGRS